jgi:microcystin-dependent protein
MSDPFVGETRVFSFDFAPEGWLPCDGRLLSISENTVLFALIGNKYGGDGKSNFAIPTLKGPDSGGEALGYYLAIVGVFPPR